MTVSSSNRKAGPFTGTGSVSSYPFTFKVFAASDLLVVRTDLSAVQTNLTLTTDYTVSLNANQDSNPGGTVTLVAGPLTSGFLLTITSSISALQAVDFTNQGGFYPNVLNTALDKLTILVQQCVEQLGRAVLVDISSSTTPAQYINQLYSWMLSAGSSASSAATSASSAANSASSAATSASNASSSATSASGSAATATSKANAASTSATNAAASETAAAGSASSASTSAINAAASATSASGSASTATTQASNASTSASNAATSATNAENSATQAASSASNAVAAFRNRIINGNMAIDQRNAGASVTQTVTKLFVTDRWGVSGSVASKFTAQQNAGAITPPSGFTKYIGITSSSNYTVGSTDRFTFIQVIEGVNVADLGWGGAGASAVTLSFWVRSSLTGTFGGAVGNQAGNRSYPFSYIIPSANTWTQVSITIPGDTTGTWVTDTTGGLWLYFSMGSGSTMSGTAGSWSGSDYRSSTGAVSVVGTNGATFYITGVQLEKGSVATPFEYRYYGTELALCQRYYCTAYAYQNLYISGSGISGETITLPVAMRTVPTCTTIANNNSNLSACSYQFYGTQFVLPYASGLAVGLASMSTSFAASAEL